jgi:hypothetical protein
VQSRIVAWSFSPVCSSPFQCGRLGCGLARRYGIVPEAAAGADALLVGVGFGVMFRARVAAAAGKSGAPSSCVRRRPLVTPAMRRSGVERRSQRSAPRHHPAVVACASSSVSPTCLPLFPMFNPDNGIRGDKRRLVRPPGAGAASSSWFAEQPRLKSSVAELPLSP